MKLGLQLDLGPSHIVLDGDLALLSAKGVDQPPPFRRMSIVATVAMSTTAELLYKRSPKNGSPYAVEPLFCLSCMSVCNVCALWPNGCMDQDETWHGGRPLRQPHCVRWGPSSPKGHGPQFSVDLCRWQTAGWMKMPLSTEAQATLC